MSQHALIKWCEDPPKWDVVNVKEIRSNREDENDETDTEEGSLVEARYGKSWFPARIIKWGKFLVDNAFKSGGLILCFHVVFCILLLKDGNDFAIFWNAFKGTTKYILCEFVCIK